MTLRLQNVQVSTDSADQEGRLVFYNDRLVAVLVSLSDLHGEDAGHWFMEVGFGRFWSKTFPLFPDLTSAAEWLEQQLQS